MRDYYPRFSRIACGVALALGPAGVLLAAEAAAVAPFFDRLISLMGIMHPMVVHFPIALLTVAAAVEILRLKFKSISPDVSYICVLFAAGGAIGATLLGLAWASTKRESDVLVLHRNLGIALTVFTVVLAVVATIARSRPQWPVLRHMQTAGILLAAGWVGAVGYFGAESMHGDGHLTKRIVALYSPEPRPAPVIQIAAIKPSDIVNVENPAPAPVEPDATESPTTSADPAPLATITVEPAQPPAVAAVQQVDFATQVWPILQEKCVDCHGERRARGNLRLDSESFALKGGRSGRPLWLPGKSDESLIIQVITTEDDLEKMPPPEEGKVVTQQEYEVLKKWIDEGATWPTLPGGTQAAAF